MPRPISKPFEGIQMKHPRSVVAGAALTALFMSATVHAVPAVTVSAVPGSPFETATVTEAVNGAGMAGMTVTACPDIGACDTRSWNALPGISAQAGGVITTNWSLVLDGDSYNSNFVFTGDADFWKSLTINARGGLTTFDWIENPELSPGSFLGKPFRLTSFDSGAVPSDNYSIAAQYSDVLHVGGQAYNDLYTVLTINVSDGAGKGFSGSMAFIADTDKTVAISPVPEPTTLLTMGLGLAFLAALRRRAVART